MRKLLVAALVLTIPVIAIFILSQKQTILSPLSPAAQDISTPAPKPLLAYAFDNLKKTTFPQSQITLGDSVSTDVDSSSQMFYFSVPKTPNEPTTEKVSGLINLPVKPGIYPVIVMFRGFVPKETYQPGIGTEPSAKVFAQNGFITIAPDFLGYGQSEASSPNGFEDRFQTTTTAVTLLSSLNSLNAGLEASYSGKIKADLTKVGIWGHSNGGQIALSALEISGVTYPTVLWAPVSKSFPYSILYYTDETDDQGMALRKALANFEDDYNTELFSLPNYFGWIKAPIEIHQGTGDQEVPVWWSDDLVATLKKNNLDVTYFTYPGADHNLLPNAWQTAVARSMIFFNQNFATAIKK